VQPARSIPPHGRPRRSTALKRPPVSHSSTSPALEIKPSAASQVLHCLPLPASRGRYLELYQFDAAYVERLRAGDPGAQEHFTVYFSEIIHLYLRSRLNTREEIEDVRQETFTRFFAALHEGRVRYPERVGAYVHRICKNVLCKKYREGHRDDEFDILPLDEKHLEIPSKALDVLSLLTGREAKEKVRRLLNRMSARKRRLLENMISDECDKDQLCLEFRVDREYLRVLLHRAKLEFKQLYEKSGE
jgi:RNA polymerase sigma-70 factor, ECF subfamily